MKDSEKTPNKNILTLTELYIILVFWSASQQLFSGLLKDVPVYYLSKHMKKQWAHLVTAVGLLMLMMSLFLLFKDIQLGTTSLVAIV